MDQDLVAMMTVLSGSALVPHLWGISLTQDCICPYVVQLAQAMSHRVQFSSQLKKAAKLLGITTKKQFEKHTGLRSTLEFLNGEIEGADWAGKAWDRLIGCAATEEKKSTSRAGLVDAVARSLGNSRDAFTKLAALAGKERKRALQISKGGQTLSPPKPHGTDTEVACKILALVWDYPMQDGIHASWAVKEHLVLKGQLEAAQNKPGLGIALFSVELAMKAFGDLAESRIDRCIAWALSQTRGSFLIQIEKTEPIDEKVEDYIPDFRHTLAFAIILARSKRMMNYVLQCVILALSYQTHDGGWPKSKGEPISEIFGALYAVELLTICGLEPTFSTDIQRQAISARNRGVHWLVSEMQKRYLWRSGFVTEDWDRCFATAWVLRRMVPIQEGFPSSWKSSVSIAVERLLCDAVDEAIWASTNRDQRFRVEARIAAALTVCSRQLNLNPLLSERVRIYLADWKHRAKAMLELPEFALELSTALFLIDSLIDPKEIVALATRVAELESK